MPRYSTTPVVCPTCGKSFLPRVDRNNQFCSVPCRRFPGRKSPDFDNVALFWEKVQKDPDGCWLWTGSKNNKGYGQVTVRNRAVLAHRYSYELAFGPIPDGQEVCHDCPTGDNPACVKPAHLFLGTHHENMRDASEKGRMASGDRSSAALHPESAPRGERHGNAKLTDEQVRRIRAEREQGVRLTVLAAQYGISTDYASALVRRVNRKDT